WSIVVQSYLTIIIGSAWLWWKPYWKPSLELHPKEMVQLARFGISVVSLRVMDFVATRLIDLIIVWRFGVAVLGVYAVGSRLYLTLMQMLQGALNDVSLSVLSRVSHDRERMSS